MIVRLKNNNFINLSEPIDISIPIHNKENPVLAWYCDPIEISPVMTDRFVGDVNKGGAVNFRNIFINPHAHGTHTECLGHISKDWVSINQCLKEFHFMAKLISIQPQNWSNPDYDQEDRIINRSDLSNKLDQLDAGVKALVIRTLPNSKDKLAQNYSNTNPIYFSKEAIAAAICRSMSSSNTGVAKMLSTGTLKNPWIWSAWRSMVSTRSIPALVSISATTLAVMGTLADRTRRSCLA